MKKLILLLATIQLICTAAPQHIEQQAANLYTILRHADDAYYNQHKSIMGDAAYNALREQLDRLISAYPELAEQPSVGAPANGSTNKVKHSIPILSLQKAYSDDDVQAFLGKCETNQLYCIEPKIDGLTVALRYSNGLLVQASTRGDGKAGTDITAAILASGAVPASLTHAPEKLEVRGEAFLSLPAFEALNDRREKAGLSRLKSPRNTAAGTLRLKDYAEVANRSLEIQIFEVLAMDPIPPTHTQALALLKSIGLPTIESRTATSADVLSAISELNQARTKFSYATDGIVIRIDDRAIFEQLGTTAHHPRGALARKYKEVPVKSRLLSVEWRIGATGKQTPVAHFEPVEIQDATVQYATLHNLDYIRAMDLQLGDWIQVIRAGGSVPEIIGIYSELRNGTEIKITAPESL